MSVLSALIRLSLNASCSCFSWFSGECNLAHMPEDSHFVLQDLPHLDKTRRKTVGYTADSNYLEVHILINMSK